MSAAKIERLSAALSASKAREAGLREELQAAEGRAIRTRETNRNAFRERDLWIVELLRERDGLRALVERASSEAISDALTFAGHADKARWLKAREGLRSWVNEARQVLKARGAAQ